MTEIKSERKGYVSLARLDELYLHRIAGLEAWYKRRKREGRNGESPWKYRNELEDIRSKIRVVEEDHRKVMDTFDVD